MVEAIDFFLLSVRARIYIPVVARGNKRGNQRKLLSWRRQGRLLLRLNRVRKIVCHVKSWRCLVFEMKTRRRIVLVPYPVLDPIPAVEEEELAGLSDEHHPQRCKQRRSVAASPGGTVDSASVPLSMGATGRSSECKIECYIRVRFEITLDHGSDGATRAPKNGGEGNLQRHGWVHHSVGT